MEKKFILAFIMLLGCSPLANASPDKDDMAFTDNKIAELRAELFKAIAENANIDNQWNGITKELQERVGKLEADVKELQKRVGKLEADVKELQERLDNLEAGTQRLEDIGRKGDKTAFKSNIALWIAIPAAVAICGILCLAFWPRESKPSSGNSAPLDKHKCPRCGWEHGPEDTVCRNPNCRTQF